MSAHRSVSTLVVRLSCDQCPARIGITSKTAVTLEEARDAVTAEFGWTYDTFTDRCPTCTVRYLAEAQS